MRIRSLLPAALALGAVLILAPAHRLEAQSFRISGQATLPTGSFGDNYNTGFGVQAMYVYRVPLLEMGVGGSYTRFGGKSGVDDANVYSAEAGAMARLGVLGAGVRAGYWFGDVEEFDVVPRVELRFLRLYAGAEYKGIFGDVQWWNTYVGIRL